MKNDDIFLIMAQFAELLKRFVESYGIIFE